MSKSKKNVVDPDQIIHDYGADTARWFMLSDSPPERDLEWTEAGVDRRLALPAAAVPHRQRGAGRPAGGRHGQARVLLRRGDALRRAAHKTIAGVSADIEAFHFNKAVARLYELASAIDGLKPKDDGRQMGQREALEIFVRLIGPMTPHLAEELWQALGHKSLLADSPWPLAEDALLVDDTVTVAVQLNGKLRGTLQLRQGRRQGRGGEGGPGAARAGARPRRQDAQAGDRGAEPDRQRRGVTPQAQEAHQWLANRTTNSNAASAIGSRPSRSPRKPRPRRRRANAPGWRMPGRRARPILLAMPEKT